MLAGNSFNLKFPSWSKPLFAPDLRYIGAKGGRGSGKSHHFAERAVMRMVADPDCNIVCIREIQKSLKFSAKKLIEDKIKALGVSHMFDITLSEIRRIGGSGICIFQGMQDHTADSIKSIEGFDIAWVEEAQSISHRSIELLLPTIRAAGSQIWFSWNPDQEDDPVEVLFSDDSDDIVCVHVNYTDNKKCPIELIKEAERHKRINPATFDHVWLGGYNVNNEKIIFNGKYIMREFDTADMVPLFGVDWGFANDPTTGVEIYEDGETLYIRREAYKIGLELDDTADYLLSHIPLMASYPVKADNARPESISKVKREGIPRMKPCKKWSGSVEDGIEFMRSYAEIVVHPDCPKAFQEFRKYSYKVDKRTGDILPKIEDDWNHIVDACRYALGDLIKKRGASAWN